MQFDVVRVLADEQVLVALEVLHQVAGADSIRPFSSVTRSMVALKKRRGRPSQPALKSGSRCKWVMADINGDDLRHRGQPNWCQMVS
jgi:hypothetical protein